MPSLEFFIANPAVALVAAAIVLAVVFFVIKVVLHLVSVAGKIGCAGVVIITVLAAIVFLIRQ